MKKLERVAFLYVNFLLILEIDFRCLETIY